MGLYLSKLPQDPLHAIQRNLTSLTKRQNETDPHLPTADKQHGYMVFTCISLFGMAVVGILLGIRVQSLRSAGPALSVTQWIVLLMYWVALFFIIGLAVLLQGVGMLSYKLCHAGISLCLVGYVAIIALRYIFLVERAHSLRRPLYRLKDWVWVSGMALLGFGFGAIAIAAFLEPSVAFDASASDCRIGLPVGVAIALLAYDLFITLLLTAAFFWFLAPALTFLSKFKYPNERGTLDRMMALVDLRTPKGGQKADQDDYFREHAPRGIGMRTKEMEKLVKNSVIGSALVMIPTAVNLSLIIGMQGLEHDWLCFTMCILDGVLNIGAKQSARVLLTILYSYLANPHHALAYCRAGGSGC